MSRGKAAVRGGFWQLSAQILMAVAQFAYGAVTARILSPADFGSFSAALSLYGLLAVLTTTGFPSYVLSVTTLSRADIRRVRLLCGAASVVATCAFLLICPLWVSLLNTPRGTEFVWIIAFAQLIGPSAVLESALLRRENRPRADASVLLSSFLLATGISAALLAYLQNVWLLALNVALTQVLLGVFSLVVRNHSSGGGISVTSTRSVLHFVRRVSTQNTTFVILTQVPNWSVGAFGGATSLGQFSRATSLTSLPATALQSAFIRTLQPHWRDLPEPRAYVGALQRSVVLTMGLVAMVFGTIAGLGGYLSTLWLGPGWEQVGSLVPWLAGAAGMQVVFALAANSAEMRSEFNLVRRAQVAFFVGLLPALALMVHFDSLVLAGLALLTSQLAALVTLLIGIARSSGPSWSYLLAPVGAHAVIWVLIGGLARLGAWVADERQWVLGGSSDAASVVLGCLAAAVGAAVVLLTVPSFRSVRAMLTKSPI
jgi:lipopolysaccharide exporter